MRHVVTGTGRSGTGWCQQVLLSAGIVSGHEGVFGPLQATGEQQVEDDWYGLDADCSWLAVPLLPMRDVKVALVVRHPLEVVASMLHIGLPTQDNRYRDIVAARVGSLDSPEDLLTFWAAWNRDGYAVADVVFTLDRLNKDPSLLTRWAGAQRSPARPRPANVRPEWKHGPRPVVTWDMFTDDLADEVRDDWRRYREET